MPADPGAVAPAAARALTVAQVASAIVGATALSRRELLAFAGVGAGVLALAGCRDTVEGAPADDATTPASSADLVLARRTAHRAAALVGALAAAVSEHRELRAMLLPLEARHREHVRAFAPESKTQFPTPVLPGTAAAALDAVTNLERQAAVTTRNDALSASSGELASALASAAACMAQHVVLLEAARDDERGGS